jgi:hypothetical protein
LRRLLPLILLLASCASAQIVPIGSVGVAGAALPSFSIVQSTQKFSCTFATSASTHTCSVTVTSTGVGHGIIVASSMFYNGLTTTAPSYASTSGDSSLVHCPSPYGQVLETTTGGNDFTVQDCAYTTSSVGGSTSFTVTMNTPNQNTSTSSSIDIQFVEFSKSSGTIALDTQNGTSYSPTSTCGTSPQPACSFPSLTLTGSNDYIFLQCILDNSFSALSSPWTNPSNVELTNVGGGFFGALNQTSYTAPSLSQTSGYATLSAIAFR